MGKCFSRGHAFGVSIERNSPSTRPLLRSIFIFKIVTHSFEKIFLNLPWTPHSCLSLYTQVKIHYIRLYNTRLLFPFVHIFKVAITSYCIHNVHIRIWYSAVQYTHGGRYPYLNWRTRAVFRTLIFPACIGEKKKKPCGHRRDGGKKRYNIAWYNIT